MDRVRAKRFECVASVEEDGVIYAEGDAPIELPPAWTSEHLLLVAVGRCTLKSLRYYARGAEVAGRASMHGTVTRRDTDGLYALVEAQVDLDVRIDPEPAVDQLAALLERAEAGCFIGNSLTVHPAYAWRVNGRPVPREG